MNDRLRKAFKDILSEMYTDNPAGLHGLVASLLVQEVNLAKFEEAVAKKEGV